LILDEIQLDLGEQVNSGFLMAFNIIPDYGRFVPKDGGWNQLVLSFAK